MKIKDNIDTCYSSTSPSIPLVTAIRAPPYSLSSLIVKSENHTHWNGKYVLELHCSVIYKDKREPTLQANSKFGLCYTPCILTLIYG